MKQGEKIGLRPRPIVPASVVVVIASENIVAEGQQPLDLNMRLPDLPTIDELIEKMPCVEPTCTDGSKPEDTTKGPEKLEMQAVLPDKKDNEDEMAALMLASSNVQSSPRGRLSYITRKRTKLLRDIDTTLNLLLPDSPETKDEKDHNFAQAYFFKVKEKLEVDDNDTFQKFMETLNEYGDSIFTVVDLYNKITSILSKYPDLSDEFLSFLLPEQAMQCGKFMEYLLITKMKDFFCLLEKHFMKQPKQIQNIQSSLSALSTQANVTIRDVKSAILPQLKGNSYLTDCFLQLLPQEQIPDSIMTDYDEMGCVEAESENSGDDDQIETLIVPDEHDLYGSDTCICLCHKSTQQKYCSRIHHCVPCGVKFIHGKVYIQAGKGLRPAKVIFPTEDIADSIRRLAPKPRVRKTRRRGSHQNEVANSQKDISPAKTNQFSNGSQCINTDSSRLTGRDMLKPKAKQRAINTYCRLREQTASITTPTTKSASSLDTSRTSKGASLKPSTKVPKTGKSNKVTRKKKVEIKNSVLKKKGPSRSQVRNKVTDDLLKSPGNSKRRTSNSVSEIVSLPPLERKRVILDLAAHQNQSNVISQMEHSTDSTYSVQVLGVEGNEVITSITNTNVKPSVLENKHLTELESKTCNSETSVLSQLENANAESDESNTKNMCVVHNETSDEILSGVKSLSNQNILFSEDMDVDCDITTSIHVTKQEPGPQVLSSDETDIISEDTAEISWTKHEDKVILKMFQEDCSTERILHLIGQQIPQRTVEQIQQRFQTLMSLLQKMTGVNVEDELNS